MISILYIVSMVMLIIINEISYDYNEDFPPNGEYGKEYEDIKALINLRVMLALFFSIIFLLVFLAGV